jgi:hypothetical protein
MNTGFSLIIALVVAVHVLIRLRVVFTHSKNEICICGHKFNLPEVGKYVCSICGKLHLTQTQ